MNKIYSFIPKIFSSVGFIIVLTIFIILFTANEFLWNDEDIRLFTIAFGIISFIIFIVITTFHFVPDRKEAFDRLRNISTVILLSLAIFGYFYTVRPTYENKKLKDEKVKLEEDTSYLNSQISQQQLELDKLTINYNELTDEEYKLLKEVEELKIDMSKKESIINNINIKSENLTLRNTELQNYISQKEQTIKEIQTNIIHLYVKDYIKRSHNFFNYHLSIPVDYYAEKWANNFKDEIFENIIVEFWTFPPFQISKSSGLPDSIVLYLNEKSMEILNKNKPNLFNYDMSKLESLIEQYNIIKDDTLVAFNEMDRIKKQTEINPSLINSFDFQTAIIKYAIVN